MRSALTGAGPASGLAFRVPLELRDEVMAAYLRERELVTNVYLERMLPVKLATGPDCGRRSATSSIDGIIQYAGNLEEEQAADIVRGAVGQSGRNEDYVFSTVQHLEALGIRDHWMEAVARRLAAG